TGPGPGAAAQIRVFSGVDGSELYDFYAFNTAWTGGVFVAAGDLLHRGVDDIIVGVDAGTNPQVRAFGGGAMRGVLLRDFYSFDVSYMGGVRVGFAVVDGSGFGDIIAGTGPGSAALVRVIDGGLTNLIRNIYAYDLSFTGGIYVAGGAVSPSGST